jgi:hypothetical protein
VTYTVTAQDGVTTEEVVVAVRLADPLPTERAYFSNTPADCRLSYVENTGGNLTVFLRIPFASGADSAGIQGVRATVTLAGVTVSSSYSYVNASGGAVSPAAISPAVVEKPYLQISFAAQSLDTLKGGTLEKIEYWLLGDQTDYVQTYKPALAFSAILAEKEDDPNKKPGGGGGGCDAGSAGLLGLVLLLGALRKRG